MIRKQKGFRRVLVAILAAATIVSSVPEATMTAYAAEVDSIITQDITEDEETTVTDAENDCNKTVQEDSEEKTEDEITSPETEESEIEESKETGEIEASEEEFSDTDSEGTEESEDENSEEMSDEEVDELGETYGDIEVKILDTYYINSDGKWTMIFEMNYKEEGSDSASYYPYVTIGYSTYGDQNDYASLSDTNKKLAYVKNIPGTVGSTVSGTYQIKRGSGGSAVVAKEGSFSVTIAASSNTNTRIKYINSGEKNFSLGGDEIDIPESLLTEIGGSSSDLNNYIIKVKDDDGNIIASSKNIGLSTKSEDPRYKDKFKNQVYPYNSGYKSYYPSSANIYFTKYAVAGEYDLYIQKGDKSAKIADNIIKVSGDTVIASFYNSSQYTGESDNQLVFYMSGINIDPAKIHPEFTEVDSSGKKLLTFNRVLTELESSSQSSTRHVYYLYDVSDSYMTKYPAGCDSFDLEWTISKPADMEVINQAGNKVRMNSQNLDFGDTYYDYKNNKIATKVKNIADKTKTYDLYLCGTWHYASDDKSLVEVITASADYKGCATGLKIGDNNMLAGALKDANGNTYVPKRNESFILYAIYQVDGKDESITRSGTMYYYYNYSEGSGSSGGTVTVSLSMYESYAYTEDIAASVEIYAWKKDGKAITGTLTLQKDGSTVKTVENVSLTSGKTNTVAIDTTGIAPGKYTTVFEPTETTIGSRRSTMWLYNKNTFYMQSYTGANRIINSGDIEIYLYAPAEYLWVSADNTNTEKTTDWVVSLYDRNHTLLYQGAPVEVDTPTYKSGYMHLYVANDQSEADFKEYPGMYVKIARKYGDAAASIATYVETGDTFYTWYGQRNTSEDSTDEYGVWEGFYNSSYSGTFSSDDYTKHGFTAAYTTAPNAKIAVYKFKSVKKLAEFSFGANNSSTNKSYNYVHTFTDSELNSKGLSKTTVYSFKILDEKGLYVNSIDGYIAGSTAAPSSTVAVSGVTISPNADVYMSVGSKKSMSATTSPSNATTGTDLTWSVADSSVATVTAAGQLEAVAVGETTVTVTTGNGKKSSVKVHVGKMTDATGTLKAEYVLEAGSGLTFRVADNNDNFPVTWSSSDTSVATVSATGYVKGVGSGTATITASTSDGLVRESTVVKVSLVATSIKLGTKNYTIKPEDTVTLTPVVYPSTAPATFTYTVDEAGADVVNVSEAGVVTAKKFGSAVITMNAVSIDAVSGTVKNYEDKATILVMDSDYEVIVFATGNDTDTLEKYEGELPSGWKFATPDAKINTIAKGVTKQFKIVNKEDSTKQSSVSVTAVLPEIMLVDPDTGKEISFSGINMVVGDTIKFKIDFKSAGTVSDERFSKASGSVNELPVIDINDLYKECFSVVKGADDVYTLTATKVTPNDSKGVNEGGYVQAKGGVHIDKANNGYTIGKSYLIYVHDATKGKADINCKIVSVNDLVEKEADVTAEGIQVTTAGSLKIVNNTAAYNGTSNAVTFTSSDPSIISIGKTDGNETPIVAKSTGIVTITAKADDTVGTTKEMIVVVGAALDAKSVLLNSYSITLNPNKSDFSETVEILAPGGNVATEVTALDKNGNPDSLYTITNTGNTVKITGKTTSTSSKVYLQVKFGDEVTVIIPTMVNVTVKKTAPKIAVKQTEKLNTFAKNTIAGLVVSVPGETINGITTDEAAKYEAVFDTPDYGKSSITGYVKLKATTKEAELKSNIMKLKVSLDGYAEPFEVTVKVGTSTVNTALSVSAGTIYIGKSSKASTQLMNKSTKTVMDLTSATVKVFRPADLTQVTEDYTASVDTYTNSINVTPKSGYSLAKGKADALLLEVQTPEMQFAKQYKFSVKYADAATIGLQFNNSKLTLYTYGEDENFNDSVAAILSIKGGSDCDMVNQITVSTGAKATTAAEYDKINIETTENGGKLYITASVIDDTVKAGTYNYIFSLGKALTGAKKDATAKLSVKVVNAYGKSKPAVKATIKGKLDVLNRSVGVSVTPKFTNVNTTNADIYASLEGDDSHLFELSEDGKTITIVDGANVVTKYKYKVYIHYEIEKEGMSIELDTPVITLPLSQSKPKVYVTGKSIFTKLKSTSSTASVIVMNASGEQVDIADIKVVNTNPAFSFETDAATGTVTITHNPSTSKTARGKSYSFKINVYPEGYSENEKPLTVTYKVSVAK